PAPSHSSSPLQVLPSPKVTPALTLTWITPPKGSQLSAVQGLPSSTSGGIPAMQAAAPSQTLTPLHTLPSSQLVPTATGVLLTPRVASQLSAVQGLASSTTR